MPHLENWQEELRRSVRSAAALEPYLSPAVRERWTALVGRMRFAITPHTLSLIDFRDPADPLWRMAVPAAAELRFAPEELADPIGDDLKAPVPHLTHRYPDRALICVTYSCATYCRFCFRRGKTGRPTVGPGPRDWPAMAAYLRARPKVEEIILSGGDPLLLTDRQLETWLRRLRTLPAVRRLRLHTRLPVTLPSRVTPQLVDLLARYQEATRPIILVTHFNHPRELAAANVAALARLADRGLVVRNQSVLLKGVNDDAATLATLFRRLTDVRVLPYYLHQLDLACGTSHWRVPLERGLALMRGLQGRVSGLALPRYVLDVPGGLGKIPLGHQYLRREGAVWIGESPFGEPFVYREPIDPEPAVCYGQGGQGE